MTQKAKEKNWILLEYEQAKLHMFDEDEKIMTDGESSGRQSLESDEAVAGHLQAE